MGDSSSSTDDLAGALARAESERDAFEAQYHGLLAKLTTMRSTLGERLRADSEELDKRSEQIEALQTEVAGLQVTVTALKEELEASHAEAERLRGELDALRSSVGGRLDAEAWERECLSERARREELEAALADATLQRDRATAREAAAQAQAKRDADSANALQAVLEDLQSGQEDELTRAQDKYDALAQTLAAESQRADTATANLQALQAAASKTDVLNDQVREKNLLIGKLRHEAVILNEHLTEALRRLRNDSPDATVDKRLVTNLLLQFLNTPRSDGKRFEMLKLIASVLGWSEQEKEEAGLQKRGHTPKESKSTVAADESFSNLFVEFLLSEAGSAPPTPSKEAT